MTLVKVSHAQQRLHTVLETEIAEMSPNKSPEQQTPPQVVPEQPDTISANFDESLFSALENRTFT